MKRIQDRQVWKLYSLLTHKKEFCLEKKKKHVPLLRVLCLGILEKKRHCLLCLSKRGNQPSEISPLCYPGGMTYSSRHERDSKLTCPHPQIWFALAREELLK